MRPLDRKFFWLCFAAVFLWALYCYNPFVLFFQNDDFIHIPLSRSGQIFQRNSFRPVCDLSMMFDAYLYDKSASGYHVTNLLLHVVACVLVFTFSRKVIAKYNNGIPAAKTASIVSLLFFVYATHSEAVFWILGRSAILGFIFSLLFLLQYVKREQTSRSIIKYVLLLFLALLSYEASFILPMLAVCFFFIDRSKTDRFHLLVVLGSFVIYLLARIYVTGEVYGQYEVGNAAGSGLLTVMINYGRLLMRSFIPAYTQGGFMVVIFSVATLAVLVLLVKNRKRKHLVVLATAFLLSLVPYSSLGIDAHGYEGERYLYFPTFFVSFLVVLLITEGLQNHIHQHLLLSIILLMHLASLSVGAENFRVAGKVNKLIIEAVNTLGATDTLRVEQLPQAQNGALIMRDGFEEAVNWMSQHKMKVIVSSRRSEWLPVRDGYRIEVEKLTNLKTNTPEFNFTDSVLRLQY